MTATSSAPKGVGKYTLFNDHNWRFCDFIINLYKLNLYFLKLI